MDLFKDEPRAPLRANVAQRKTPAERMLEILEKVKPSDLSIQDAIDRGVLDPFGVTQEVRDAFARLKPSEQIFAAFWGVAGVDGKALLALCRHAAFMERDGLLRDLKVDKELIACPVSDSDGLDDVIPPGTPVGPELAAAALRCKQALRGQQ